MAFSRMGLDCTLSYIAHNCPVDTHTPCSKKIIQNLLEFRSSARDYLYSLTFNHTFINFEATPEFPTDVWY